MGTESRDCVDVRYEVDGLNTKSQTDINDPSRLERGGRGMGKGTAASGTFLIR